MARALHALIFCSLQLNSGVSARRLCHEVAGAGRGRGVARTLAGRAGIVLRRPESRRKVSTCAGDRGGQRRSRVTRWVSRPGAAAARPRVRWAPCPGGPQRGVDRGRRSSTR